MKPLNILILIVEDDKYLNETIREVLEDEGFVIESALNPVDALIKIKHGKKKFHILLLDYNLNDKYGINGLDVFETAKKINPDIRGIMISAYGEKYVKEKCRKLGILIFLDKPFLVTELIENVKIMAEEYSSEEKII